VKPAPEAQTDQTTRPVDQSASNNIYSASTGSKVTTADQRADQSREQEQFVCPECGKSFARESSLKAHMLAKHKIPVQWRKGKPPTPTKERGKGGEVEEEVQVPSVEDTLKNLLVTFGVTKRDADACIEYLKPYGYDNLIKLHEALSDLGLSLSRRRLIIESWANLRNLRIPPQLLTTLRIKGYGADYMEYEDYYNYGYRPSRRPRYEDEVNVANPVLAEAIRSNTKITEKLLEAQLTPRPPNSNDQLIQQLFQRLERLEERNKELEKKLEEKEKELLKMEIESLKAEIRELKEDRRTMTEIEFKDRRWQDFSQKVDRILSWIEAMGRPRTYPPEYEGESEATPTEEELRELGISEEWIEEE